MDLRALGKRVITHELAGDASWLFAGQAANVCLQALSFLLLARLLGVDQYGVFAGAFALVNIVTPYSSFGSGLLFMRYVTADRTKAPVYWGNSLLITGISTLVLVALFAIIGPRLTHVRSPLLFVCLTVSNCLLTQITILSSTVFRTFGKMQRTAALSLLTNLARLILLLLMLVTLRRVSASQWAVCTLVASAIAATIAVTWVRRVIGRARFEYVVLFKRMKEGLGFSFAGTTQAVYNDVDKTMLSHYGMMHQNGFYTLAYRIVDFASTPVGSLDSTILPRFFRLNLISVRAVSHVARKVLIIGLCIGSACGLGVAFLGPLLLPMVGKDFSGLTRALHWLCWLVPLRALHQISGSALTGSGNQNRRTCAQVSVAMANILLNLWSIPKYGWMGAAWSSVASDGLLAACNIGLLIQLTRRGASPSVEETIESDKALHV